MRVLVGAICLMFLVIPSGVPLRNTSLAWAAQPSQDPQFGTHRNEQLKDEARIEREMAKERNKERQKKLKADTDKLLQLAAELKQYVDRTNENVLSVEVLKKTDEIEKLAKSVHDGMKAGNYQVGVQ